jgi:cell division protein FtsB
MKNQIKISEVSAMKKTKEKTVNNKAESKRSDRVTRVNGIDDDAWKTRVYENDLARMTRKHAWIGEEDDADKLRNAAAGTGTNAAGYETKVFEGLQFGRQYTQPEIEPPLSEQRRESEKKAAGSGMSIPDKIRSMRRIRIGDRRRFRRLLAVLALIVIVIVFEACFFVMEDRVSKLPAEIKNVQEQTADLTEDNKKLQEENENLGDSESKKELKESWERLRDKVKEAVGETSS